MTIICVSDVETTGISDQDKLVELATIRFNTDKTNNDYQWSARFNPGRPIPPEASAIHHIVDSDVVNCDKFSELDWHDASAGAEILAAHNADFDCKFLPLDKDPRFWICTYKCALRIWPDAPGHSNQCLRYFLNLDLKIPHGLAPHSALYDAMTTTGLVRRLLEEITIDKAIDISSKPALQRICRFGKFKDQKWEEVDEEYLRWVIKDRAPEVQFAPEVLYTAKYWLHKKLGK